MTNMITTLLSPHWNEAITIDLNDLANDLTRHEDGCYHTEFILEYGSRYPSVRTYRASIITSGEDRGSQVDEGYEYNEYRGW